jgi:hypothetical protein
MPTNLYPSQSRAIDPFSSYNSNSVNVLTRMVSLGQNCIIGASSMDVVWDSTSTTIVTVCSGICFKDDVIINITDNFKVDMSVDDFYVTQAGAGMNEAGYFYIVLDYTYSKSLPAPQAAIRIIKPSQVLSTFNTSKYLFLKAVNIQLVSSIMEIVGVYDIDPTFGFSRNYSMYYAGGVNTLPTPYVESRDEGRIIYARDTKAVYYGQNGTWTSLFSGISHAALADYATNAGAAGNAANATNATNANYALNSGELGGNIPSYYINNTQFPVSLTEPGYTKLPNGLIIQWGESITSGATGSNVQLSVTFPITFPNACLFVLPGGRDDITSGQLTQTAIKFVSSTTSGAIFNSDSIYSQGNGNTYARYMAIGY